MARRHTIGQVVRELSPEFPDLTISKVRFLEGRGLVTPERTPAGYRLFSDEQVERLRFVLTSQRDRFWPLKVIADALDQMDRGLEVDLDAPAPGRPAPPPHGALPAASEWPAAAALGDSGPAVRVSRAEICRAAEVTASQLEDMAAFGLLRADREGWFTGADVQIARSVGALAQFGIEPRHLRTFRLAADREVALVEQTLNVHRGDAQEREQVRHELAAHCLALHVALVRSALQSGG